MEDEIETLDSSNEQTDSVDTDIVDIDTSDSDTQTEDSELALLKQKNRQLFERAKKAEGFTLVEGKWVRVQKTVPKPAVESKETPSGLSPKDYLALTENKVSSEEFDKVMEISKLLSKTVAETLKDKTARIILQAYREELATADATAATPSRKSGQSSGSRILADYQQGRAPETEEAAAELAKAQFEQLLKGTK